MIKCYLGNMITLSFDHDNVLDVSMITCYHDNVRDVITFLFTENFTH
jgi:hypothetical protein